MDFSSNKAVMSILVNVKTKTVKLDDLRAKVDTKKGVQMRRQVITKGRSPDRTE